MSADTTATATATTTATLPCCIYYYRQTRYGGDAEGGVYRFKMEAILQTTLTREYDTRGIVRSSTLSEADLQRLQVFNGVCIPECNAASMRFVFASRQHGAYACSVTPTGQLSIDRFYAVPPSHAAVAVDDAANDADATMPPTVRTPTDGDLDTYHAASIYTAMHDYVQTTTRDRCVHVGLSFVPCGTLFLPLWLGDGTGLRGILAREWYEQRLALARAEARLTVRLLGGDSCVRHVVPRPQQKAKHASLMSGR